jgi:SAM-dependent methyltransferase
MGLNQQPSIESQARLGHMTQRQRDYYAETASAYESMHVQPGDEHFIALEYVTALLPVVRAKSVLDVGSGTGRAVRFLQQRRPELQVEGVEPVGGLREQAQVLGTVLHDASGEDLPFPDDSFDVVMSFGLLHHVPDPVPVVTEMARVARFGVMISDSNRFGQGSTAHGMLKLAIHGSGLWSAFERFRTRGRGYMESDGDGIFYSYSIFDSVPQLQAWADRIFVVPTKPQKRLTLIQTTTSHGLLVAFREPSGPGWAGC